MNENQNPNANNNVVSGGVYPSVNQNPSVGQNNVNTVIAQPTTNAAPVQPVSVQPTVQSNVAPVGPAQVTPAIQNTVSPVIQGTASPMPANPTQVVQAAPMPSQVAPVQPTPVQAAPESTTTPFFTPTSVQPEIQVSPELPPLTEPSAPVQVEVPTQAETVDNTNGLEVIQTAPKSKASNVVIIIFLIILIVFVFNIDTVISIYDSFKNQNNVENTNNKNTNNVLDGYILIDDNTSSIKIKDIKFYNFRKTVGKGITFSYEVLAKHDDAKSLEIYVELYNSEKEILYKELFNPEKKLEKDTVSTYVMHAEDKAYSSAFYALVKIYTAAEKKTTSSLTCTLSDKKYTYKNVYNFVNNGLLSYDVLKTSNKENDEKLTSEYEELKDTNNATLENNTLKYSVNLEADNGDLVIPFEKNTTLIIVKDNLTLKEWKCE